MHELQVDALYEPVLTTDAGLWRWRNGDLLRCVGFLGAAPKLVVEGRRTTELNICSEKTSEAALLRAVAAATGGALPGGAPALAEWAARECLHAPGGGAPGVGHYLFYLELERGAECKAERLAAAVEAALRAESASYRRVGPEHWKRLAPAEVRLVAAGAFAAVRELALAAGASAKQYKPPVVVHKAEQVAALEAHVVAAAHAPADV